MLDSKYGNFATKLSSLLQSPEWSSIICWSEERRSIDVLSEGRLESQVLPVFFRQRKYESFVRQLNLYGFRKLKAHPTPRFTHPLLHRGGRLADISTVKKGRSEEGKERGREETVKGREAEEAERVGESEEKQVGKDGIDTLAENGSIPSSTPSLPIVPEVTSSYFFNFAPVVYFINPFFSWGCGQLYNTPPTEAPEQPGNTSQVSL